MAEKTERSGTELGLNRIRQIMKSSPEVGLVSNESVFLVKVATEMFIKMMASNSFDEKNGKQLEYKDLAAFVEKKPNMDFLIPILPQKITVKKYREIMEKEKLKKKNLNSDEDTSSSEGESDSEEGSEESSSEGESGSSDSGESVEVVEKSAKAKSAPTTDVIELSSSESNLSTK